MAERTSRAAAKKSPRKKQANQAAAGAAKMRDAADRILQNYSEEIAEALYESAKSGHIHSTKLLCALAEDRHDAGDPEIAQMRESLAAEWAADQHWFASVTDAESETGQGGREPED